MDDSQIIHNCNARRRDAKYSGGKSFIRYFGLSSIVRVCVCVCVEHVDGNCLYNREGEEGDTRHVNTLKNILDFPFPKGI